MKFVQSIEKSEDEQSVTFYGVIADLPIENRESCMKWLLDANLFGFKTRDAIIGIDADTEEIYLFKTIEISHMLFDRFYEELTTFVEQQHRWTDMVMDRAYNLNYAA